MATSSKRASSSKQSSGGGKARAISVKRKDALPRTGNVAAARRKPVVQPPIDGAPAELLATAVAGSKKKARSPQQAETATRTKTKRAAGRASGKLNKPAATEMVTAPEPVAETVGAVEPVTTADAVSAMTALETESEVEACAIVEETTIVQASVEAVNLPSTAHAKRPVITAVARLLSTLCRWTGVRP